MLVKLTITLDFNYLDHHRFHFHLGSNYIFLIYKLGHQVSTSPILFPHGHVTDTGIYLPKCSGAQFGLPVWIGMATLREKRLQPSWHAIFSSKNSPCTCSPTKGQVMLLLIQPIKNFSVVFS